jgi:hypothetical protein
MTMEWWPTRLRQVGGLGFYLDGLNQVWVIVSTTRHIDLFRDRPHALLVERLHCRLRFLGTLKYHATYDP